MFRAGAIILAATGLFVLTPATASADFDQPKTLSAAGGTAGGTRVAMTPSGHAYVVWERLQGGGQRDVEGRRATPSGVFGPVQTVGPGGDNGAYAPDVAINPAGKILVVYRGGTDYGLYAAEGTVGNALGSPLKISHNGPGNDPGGSPRVAINKNGAAIVLWMRSRDGRLFARFRTADGYGPITAVSPAADNVTDWEVAISDDVAVAMWRTSNNEIKVREHPISSTWRAVRPMGTGQQPQIAMASSGHALIVWRNDSGDVTARKRSPSGVYGQAVTLSAPAATADLPAVAITPIGDALVAWSSAGVPNVRVYSRARAANGKLGPIQALTPASRVARRGVRVAINASGKAVIVYAIDLNGSDIIQLRSRNAAGVFGAPENLSTSGADARLPQTAIASGGTAVAVWDRPDTAGAQRIQGTVGK